MKYLIAKAVEHQFGTTDSGNEYIAVIFSIAEGPRTSERLTWYGYFTDKTTERTMEALRYCGWAGDLVTELDGLGDNFVQISVDHETYEGKTREKIQWVNQIRGAVVKNAMDNDAKAAFAKRMKGAAQTVSKDKATAVGYAPQASSAGEYDGGSKSAGDPGPSNDDIPF